jgi:hypothetical protein
MNPLQLLATLYALGIDRIPKLGKRRGQSAVWAVFGLALMILMGVLVFSKVYPSLTALQDSTFSSAANATIAGTATDFYGAVDLLRIGMIVTAIVVIIGILAYVGRGG